MQATEHKGRRGTPQCTVNQLQVELLANVGWKYWQMNKFQYVSNGRFFAPGEMISHPGRRKRIGLLCRSVGRLP